MSSGAKLCDFKHWLILSEPRSNGQLTWPFWCPVSSPVNGEPQDISHNDVCEFDEFKSKASGLIGGTEGSFLLAAISHLGYCNNLVSNHPSSTLQSNTYTQQCSSNKNQLMARTPLAFHWPTRDSPAHLISLPYLPIKLAFALLLDMATHTHKIKNSQILHSSSGMLSLTSSHDGLFFVTWVLTIKAPLSPNWFGSMIEHQPAD